MQTNEKQNLAIANIPCQTWSGNLYEAPTALRKGTIFPELNMPFFVVDSPDDQIKDNSFKCDEQQERETLLCQINEASFYVTDLTLYLDTHETDKEALKLFHDKVKLRGELMETFAAKFYPLTVDCIAKCGCDENEYQWSKGPLPWEGACV